MATFNRWTYGGSCDDAEGEYDGSSDIQRAEDDRKRSEPILMLWEAKT